MDLGSQIKQTTLPRIRLTSVMLFQCRWVGPGMYCTELCRPNSYSSQPVKRCPRTLDERYKYAKPKMRAAESCLPSNAIIANLPRRPTYGSKSMPFELSAKAATNTGLLSSKITSRQRGVLCYSTSNFSQDLPPKACLVNEHAFQERKCLLNAFIQKLISDHNSALPRPNPDPRP
jgi:hypothetical protein